MKNRSSLHLFSLMISLLLILMLSTCSKEDDSAQMNPIPQEDEIIRYSGDYSFIYHGVWYNYEGKGRLITDTSFISYKSPYTGADTIIRGVDYFYFSVSQTQPEEGPLGPTFSIRSLRGRIYFYHGPGRYYIADNENLEAGFLSFLAFKNELSSITNAFEIVNETDIKEESYIDILIHNDSLMEASFSIKAIDGRVSEGEIFIEAN